MKKISSEESWIKTNDDNILLGQTKNINWRKDNRINNMYILLSLKWREYWIEEGQTNGWFSDYFDEGNKRKTQVSNVEKKRWQIGFWATVCVLVIQLKSLHLYVKEEQDNADVGEQNKPIVRYLLLSPLNIYIYIYIYIYIRNENNSTTDLHGWVQVQLLATIKRKMTAMELAPATQISNAKEVQAQRDAKRKKEDQTIWMQILEQELWKKS